MPKKRKNQTCYICDELATSKEHVPPLCLFPEEKDIKTSYFRNNLLTVPSCDIHNSKKSKDDEFLMACLTGIVGNNIIGYFHNQTKVKRAIQRKDYDFLDTIMKNRENINVTTNLGQKLPILIGQPDTERLQKCFEHIAYGLYFNKFGHTFKGKIISILDFVTYEDDTTEKYKLVIRTRIEVEKNKRTIEGNNPEIFKYEFFEPDEFGLIGLQLQFYEGAKVFIAFQGKDSIEPSNLMSLFINSGLTTIINFGEKQIIFNEKK